MDNGFAVRVNFQVVCRLFVHPFTREGSRMIQALEYACSLSEPHWSKAVLISDGFPDIHPRHIYPLLKTGNCAIQIDCVMPITTNDNTISDDLVDEDALSFLKNVAQLSHGTFRYSLNTTPHNTNSKIPEPVIKHDPEPPLMESSVTPPKQQALYVYLCMKPLGLILVYYQVPPTAFDPSTFRIIDPVRSCKTRKNICDYRRR